MHRFLLVALLVAAVPAAAQGLPDTADNRAALAHQLSDLEAPNIRQAVGEMISGVEQGVAPPERAIFRKRLDTLFNYELVRHYTDEVTAREMSTDELAALIAFYTSPVGHSVMLKMPQLARDTVPGISGLLRDALARLAAQPPPPAGSSL